MSLGQGVLGGRRGTMGTMGTVSAMGRGDSWAGMAVRITAASLFLAMTAQVSFNIPWSPVPITGQTFGLLAIAAALGPKESALAVLLYIAEGLAGLPVFAGFNFGLVTLLKPSGGYIVGFIPAAFVAGYVYYPKNRTTFRTIALFTLATAIVFAVGLSWLRVALPGMDVLSMGLWPYIPGAGLKICLAALVTPAFQGIPRKR